MSGQSQIPPQHVDLTGVAAAWLAALDAGSADVAAFKAWRDADIRHAVAFAEMAGTWRELNALRTARSETRCPSLAQTAEPVLTGRRIVPRRGILPSPGTARARLSLRHPA